MCPEFVGIGGAVSNVCSIVNCVYVCRHSEVWECAGTVEGVCASGQVLPVRCVCFLSPVEGA